MLGSFRFTSLISSWCLRKMSQISPHSVVDRVSWPPYLSRIRPVSSPWDFSPSQVWQFLLECHWVSIALSWRVEHASLCPWLSLKGRFLRRAPRPASEIGLGVRWFPSWCWKSLLLDCHDVLVVFPAEKFKS